MYAKSVQITGKGQLVVPMEIRSSMGLEKGSKLIIIQSGEDILLKKPESFEAFVDEKFPGLKAATERVFGKVWEGEEDSLWESYIND